MTNLSVKKKNEVYVTIQSEEEHVHRELADYFTFEVPEAKYLKKNPRYRHWDGTIRLYSPGTGSLYCGLIDHLQTWADEREYKIYLAPDEWYGDVYEDNDFVTPPGVKTFMDKVCNIKPRPYQYKAVYEALKNNRKLLLSPTGSGKSLMIYSIVRYYAATAKKILIIVPTTSLVEQMVNDFIDYGWSAEDFVHKIYGGKDKNIISEFNGPVVFNKKVTTNAPVEANSLFIQGEETIARKYSVGVSTPSTAGNVGDITFDSEPSSGGTAGWVYTDDNNWQEFGPIKAIPDGSYVGIFSGSFKGDGSQLTNVSDVWVFDGVGISTTAQVGIETTQAKNGYSLYAAGAVLFENTVEFRMDQVLWNVPDGWLINTVLLPLINNLMLIRLELLVSRPRKQTY